MEFQKQYQPLFSKEYDYLNRKYEKFQQSLSAIDYELDNTLVDKGITPKFEPQGRGYTDPDLRQRRKEFLERTRERRVRGFKASLQKDTVLLEEKQQAQIYDRFDFETSRHGFKEFSKSDLKTVKDYIKEDKASTDYMAAQYFSKYRQPDKASVADEKENLEAWSDRYLNLIYEYRTLNGSPEIDEPDFNKE